MDYDNLDIDKGVFALEGTKTSLRLLLQRVHRCIDGLGRAVDEGNFGAWLYGVHHLEQELLKHLGGIIPLHIGAVLGENDLELDPVPLAQLLAARGNATDMDWFWGPGFDAEVQDTRAVMTALLNQPFTNAEVEAMSPEERAEYEEYLEGRSEAHRLERDQ